MIKASDVLLARDLTKIQLAQEWLLRIWREQPDKCLSYEEFEELKRILRKIEDWHNDQLNIQWDDE